MSSNAIGTVFRIGLIFISLILIWLSPIILGYYLICLIFEIKFSFDVVFLLFMLCIFIRMFYPKNVFRT